MENYNQLLIGCLSTLGHDGFCSNMNYPKSLSPGLLLIMLQKILEL